MSMKNLATLKGVFPHPKPLPKRDFIKENKLKIRTDQKCSTQRKSNIGNCEFNSTKTQFQHSRDDSAGIAPVNRVNSGCSCTAKKSFNAAKGAKLKYQRESLKCDRSIQTDDIIDEAFLANALSRIVTQDTHQNYDKTLTTYPTKNSFHAKATQFSHSTETNKFAVNLAKFNHDNQMSETQELILRQPNNGIDFQKSNTKDKAQGVISHRPELRTKKEIRIPNYLEREKREKKLQRIREMEKDPHCPEGHYVLSEEERKTSLSAAENLFRDLVNELNRMPMSSETLRIRNRKMEIEKALMDLEKTIRKFSKPKVYVRADN